MSCSPTIFRVNSLWVLGRVDHTFLEQLLVFVLSQGPDVMPRWVDRHYYKIPSQKKCLKKTEETLLPLETAKANLGTMTFPTIHKRNQFRMILASTSLRIFCWIRPSGANFRGFWKPQIQVHPPLKLTAFHLKFMEKSPKIGSSWGWNLQMHGSPATYPPPEIAGVPYDQGLWKPIGFP